MIDLALKKSHIYKIQYNKQELIKESNLLLSEKAKFDRSFSEFLGGTHHYAMQPDEADQNHILWKQYKQMRKDYTELENLIKITQYYIGKQ